MNERELNARLVSGRRNVEEQESRLESSYLRVYDEARQGILASFDRNAVMVAAAGSDWEPPQQDQLLHDQIIGAGAFAFLLKRLKTMLAALVNEVLGGDFDPDVDAARTFVETIARTNSSEIMVGLREPVAQSLASSQEAGLSFGQARQALSTAIRDASKYQAAALARTGAAAVANSGSQLSVQMLNARSAKENEPQFTLKRWNTAHDERVRPTHVAASGQEVPVESAFIVGGASLAYPCDPSGPIAETWSCRCYLTFHERQTVVASAPPTTLPSEASMSAIPINSANDLWQWTVDGYGNLVSTESPSAYIGDPLIIHPEASPFFSDLQAAVTVTVDEQGAAVEAEPVPWGGVLAVENLVTADGRMFLPGSFTHRDLPLTLLAQIVTAEGHDGAEVCGRIDRVWRRDAPEFGEGAVAVMGGGVFDVGEFGQETARKVADRVLRGVSVDLARYEVVLLDAETLEPVPEDQVDFEKLLVGGYVMGFTLAEMGAATVCALQAFDDATIAVLATDTGVLVASSYGFTTESLVASQLAPLKPPRAWFEIPEPDELTPMTYTPEGFVCGHASTWQCHEGYIDRCVQPPRSRYNLAYFHVGEIETAEGDLLPIGKITVTGGHADKEMTRSQAMAHYDDCTSVGAFVRAVEGRHGVWVCGTVRNDLSPERLRDMRANPPSGDWRAGELIAFHSVVVPGLPILRTEARVVVASDGHAEVATLITPPVLVADCGCDGMSEQEYATRIGALSDLAGL